MAQVPNVSSGQVITASHINAVKNGLYAWTADVDANDYPLTGLDRIQINSGTLPVSPTTGTLALDSADTSLKLWDGSAWRTFVNSSVASLASLTAVGSTLQLGGATASFPMLKRNTTQIDVRLANDSAFCDLRANKLTALNFEGINNAVRLNDAGPGIWTMTNSTNNNFDRLIFGAGTNSFPALKRNGTAINVRLADDSADAPITASNATFSGTLSVTSTATFSADAINSSGAFVQRSSSANDFMTSFYFQKRGTTGNANAAVASGAELGGFLFQGWDGSAYQSGSTIAARSAEAWSGTARGTRLTFSTTAATTTSLTEKMRLTEDGNLLIGTTTNTASSGTGKHYFTGNTARVFDATRTPASATATGNVGEMCFDSSYVYICVAANTWRRAAHSTW